MSERNSSSLLASIAVLWAFLLLFASPIQAHDHSGGHVKKPNGNAHTDHPHRIVSSHSPHLQDSEKVLKMTFSEHDDYKNLSREYDHLWDDLLTPNGGFLRKHYGNGQIHGHGISMFHQLHCLGMMRSAYQVMEDKVNSLDAGKPQDHDHHMRREASPPTHEHVGKGHWLHCFDYLRQAILCNADATVEFPTVDKKGEPVVDGMIPRKCNDWKALYDASVNSDRVSDVL